MDASVEGLPGFASCFGALVMTFRLTGAVHRRGRSRVELVCQTMSNLVVRADKEQVHLPAFLAAGGGCANLIARRDWSQTLGPLETWPQSLKTATAILLRSPVPIVMLWGMDGIMIYNDAYSSFAGGRHPELLGSRVREGWPEVADFNDHVMRVGLAGGTLHYKDQELTLHRHGRPEQVFMNLDFSPVPGDDGEPAGVLCILGETTERVIAERERAASAGALRAERDRLRGVLDNMHEGFVLLDRAYRVIDINAEGLRLDRRSREDILGRTHWEAWPGTEGSALGLLYKRVMTERVPAGLEHRYEWPDGRHAWFDMRAYPTSDGIALFYRDVTEKKNAEEAATAQAAERSAILGQLAEGVIVADAQGRITFVNEAAERLHGMKLLGVAPDDYSESYRLLTEDGRSYPTRELPLARAVLDGATVEDARWRIRRPDGSEVLAIGSARPILSNGDERLGAVLTLRDDTARMRTENDLRALNEELERRVAEEVSERLKAEEALAQAQKMEAIGQLTGGVAHDFNNLLGAVVGNLDLLSRKLGDERLRRYVDGAMAGAQRGAQLTRQLLAFARRQRLAPQAVDVNNLVEGTVRNLLQRALGGIIEVELLPADDLWPATVDPVQLESAILNLALNARDAMPDGGYLAIETSNVRVAAGTNADLAPGDYVLVAVTDTGSGMSPDVVARATEPFFTTKGVGKGTGLGLSTVYGFLRQTGGTLRITSHLGQGTTVQLYVPRSPSVPETNADQDLSIERHTSGEIVLLVDDDSDVRSTTTEMLSELGYAVVAAPGGARALDILSSNAEIRLILTDYAMPGMNGAEFLKRAREVRPDLRALVATGYAQDAELDRSLEGARVIRKPFSLADLAAALRS